MRAGLLAATVAAAVAGATPGFAQESEATQVEDVVVTGAPLRRQVQVFVDSITTPPRGHGPARWREATGVCVGVVNLRRETAQAIVDRVSAIALDLGLRVGDPGCSPNVVIVATDDAPGIASALVERRPLAFRPRYSGASRSRRALAEFVSSDQPIRWWHVSMPMAEDGTPAVRLPGNPDAPFVRGGTRLRTTVQNVLLRAYVIIDFDQIEALTVRQLADYAALVAFAQIDPEAEVGGFDTILNVLDNPSAAAELTSWDRSYLSALYGSELHQRRPGAQLSDVAGMMFRREDRARAMKSGD